MYGIFTYSWLKFSGNVGEYSIHGSYGIQTGSKAVFLLGSGCYSFPLGVFVHLLTDLPNFDTHQSDLPGSLMLDMVEIVHVSCID